jgi:hypothetical protein
VSIWRESDVRTDSLKEPRKSHQEELVMELRPFRVTDRASPCGRSNKHFHARQCEREHPIARQIYPHNLVFTTWGEHTNWGKMVDVPFASVSGSKLARSSVDLMSAVSSATIQPVLLPPLFATVHVRAAGDFSGASDGGFSTRLFWWGSDILKCR